MKSEYDLDYSKARPNPFAAALKPGDTVYVLGSKGSASPRPSQRMFISLKVGARLWNKWRSKNPTIGLDFDGIDLSGGSLAHFDLSHLDLAGINFNGANLSHADLSGASLRGANFADADLTGANLSGADLMDAHFNETNLRDADLSGTILADVDLAGVNT